jgi:hypothetical protein
MPVITFAGAAPPAPIAMPVIEYGGR